MNERTKFYIFSIKNLKTTRITYSVATDQHQAKVQDSQHWRSELKDITGTLPYITYCMVANVRLTNLRSTFHIANKNREKINCCPKHNITNEQLELSLLSRGRMQNKVRSCS
jgi:hypothetical protein